MPKKPLDLDYVLNNYKSMSETEKQAVNFNMKTNHKKHTHKLKSSNFKNWFKINIFNIINAAIAIAALVVAIIALQQ